jgi:hypothetical protein
MTLQRLANSECGGDRRTVLENERRSFYEQEVVDRIAWSVESRLYHRDAHGVRIRVASHPAAALLNPCNVSFVPKPTAISAC